MKDWYQVRQFPGLKLIHVMGFVEFTADDASFARFARDVDSGLPAVHLTIDSEGGSAMAALMIYTRLKPLRLQMTITHKCLSAAVIIAMAAGRLKMAEDAIIGVHPARQPVNGNAEGAARQAGILQALNEQQLRIVAERTKNPPAAAAWFAAGETWLTAKEALAAGLVDEIVPSLRVQETKPAPQTKR